MMNTDKRLSAALLELLPALAQQQSASAKNAAVLAADSPAVAAVLRQMADNFDAMGARLSDVIEALAAGTIRIVDEARLTEAIAGRLAFTESVHTRQEVEDSAYLGAAGGFVDHLRESGVLR